MPLARRRVRVAGDARRARCPAATWLACLMTPPRSSPHPPRAMSHSIDSLDSVSVASDSSFGTDDEELLEQEWKESIGQLQQLLSVVLLPIFGRWLGRKWSFWGQSHYRMNTTLGSCPYPRHSVC